MLDKITEIVLTTVTALITIGLVCGMGIAITIMSIVDGAPFGVFVGVIMIAAGIFTFCIVQRDARL